MRLPVSRARFDLLEHNFHEARKLAHAEETRANELSRLLDRALDSNQRLIEFTQTLRVSGADPAPQHVVPDAPLSQLGPLTRVALQDMGHGQSGMVKRAMQTKALAIWLDNRAHENCDELTAIAVRQGEVR